MKKRIFQLEDEEHRTRDELIKLIGSSLIVRCASTVLFSSEYARSRLPQSRSRLHHLPGRERRRLCGDRSSPTGPVSS